MAGGCTPSKEKREGEKGDSGLSGAPAAAEKRKEGGKRQGTDHPKPSASSSSSPAAAASSSATTKMTTRVAVVFHSLYGHVYKMAEAVAEGARSVGSHVEVDVFQVPETLSAEVLDKMHATEAKKAFEHIPVMENPAPLADYDAIIIGTGTRFGLMSAQMKTFFDHMGQLWQGGKLIGKIGSVFTSTATQHGGQETTQVSSMIPMIALGMLVVGVPYSEQRLFDLSEAEGGSAFGASTIAGGDGSRQPLELELGIASSQGAHVAKLADALRKGKE